MNLVLGVLSWYEAGFMFYLPGIRIYIQTTHNIQSGEHLFMQINSPVVDVQLNTKMFVRTY